MGQAILVREELPQQISIIQEGQVRLLGLDPHTNMPVTLQLLQPGEILGWVSLVRGVPCETAIASSETICLNLPAAEFFNLLKQPVFKNHFHNRCHLAEAFDLLSTAYQQQAVPTDLKQLALSASPQAVVRHLPPGKTPLSQLNSNLIWYVSSGESHFPVGSRLDSVDLLEVTTKTPARLVGFPTSTFERQSLPNPSSKNLQPPTPNPPKQKHPPKQPLITHPHHPPKLPRA